MSDPVMEDGSMNDRKHPELAKSDLLEYLPRACGDEKAAVEFFERQRWGHSPVCPHCRVPMFTYCDEFAFRWGTRKFNDGERVVEAVKRTEGKRLTCDQYVCRN